MTQDSEEDDFEDADDVELDTYDSGLYDIEEADNVELDENEVEDGGDDSASDSPEDEPGDYQIDGMLILCLNLLSYR